MVATVKMDKPEPYVSYMMKLPKTPRAKEKALEKELPWSMIPPDQHEGFKLAERTQYDEHIQHGALEPRSPANQARPTCSEAGSPTRTNSGPNVRSSLILDGSIKRGW